MGNSADIFDANRACFQKLVIEQSHQLPVLVDFWADWCAPCRMLTPVLLKLVEDYQGSFKLAKVNTDIERELAADHAIRSLPTLRLYQHGEVVQEFVGAQTESTLRALLDAHVERPSDRLLAEAMGLVAQGNQQQALECLEQAYQDDPENPRLPLQYARIAIRAGHLDRAQQVLETLPVAFMGQPDSDAVKVLLELARSTKDTQPAVALQEILEEDPSLCEPRYQLAAHQTLSEDYDSAMDNFMELLRRDRNYRADIVQRSLVTLFALIGNENEHVTRYRRQMFNLLH